MSLTFNTKENRYYANSTDKKPSGTWKINGAELFEIDTGSTYRYDAESNTWYRQKAASSGESQVVTKDITMTIGTVATGDAGSKASAKLNKTSSGYSLDLTIPKGDKGEKGDKGDRGLTVSGDGQVSNISLKIGSVTEGDTASASIDEAEDGFTLNLVLPKGEKGDKGDTGATGAKGEKGDKGDTGADGAPGAKGEKGDKGDTGAPGRDGTGGSSGTPTNVNLAIGTVTTGTEAAATLTPTANGYTLNLVLPKGDKGDKGDTGATGAAGAKGDKGDKGDTGAAGTGGDVDLTNYYNKAETVAKINELSYSKADVDSKIEAIPSSGGTKTYNKYVVVGVWGQSNAVGYDESLLTKYDVARDPARIFQYSDSLKPLTYCAENIQDMNTVAARGGSNIASIRASEDSDRQRYCKTKGIHLPLANLMLDAIPEDYAVIIVPAAQGGRPIANFVKGQSYYNTFITRMKAAMDLNPDNILSGIIWCQGENNCGQSGESYVNTFRQLVNDVNNDLSAYATRTTRGSLTINDWYFYEWPSYYKDRDSGGILTAMKNLLGATYVPIPYDTPRNTTTFTSSTVDAHFGQNTFRTVIAPRVFNVMRANGAFLCNAYDKDTVPTVDMTAYDRSISEIDEKILSLEKSAALLNGTKAPAEPWRQAGEGDYQWMNSPQATNNTFSNGTFQIGTGNGKSGLWFPKDCVAIRFARAANSGQPVFVAISQNESTGAHNALFVSTHSYPNGLWRANDANSSFSGTPSADNTNGLSEKLKQVSAGTKVEFRKTGDTSIRITIDGQDPVDYDISTDSAQYAAGSTIRFGFNTNWTGNAGYIATEIELYDESAEDKTGVSTYTLAAANWTDVEGGGATYSLEADYPFEDYKITVEPDGDALTAAQYDAWVAGKIVGSNTASQIKALGTKPTEDIPAIVTAARKPAVPKKLVKVHYVSQDGTELQDATTIDLLKIASTEGDGFTDLKSATYIPVPLSYNGVSYTFDIGGGINMDVSGGGNHIFFGKKGEYGNLTGTSVQKATLGGIQGYQMRFIKNDPDSDGFYIRQGGGGTTALAPGGTEIFIVYKAAS